MHFYYNHLFMCAIRSICLFSLSFIHLLSIAYCVKLRANQSVSGGGGGWSGPKGGDLQINCPGQHVLEQSAVVVTRNGDIIAQFTVNLPARGRTILGGKAIDIFERVLPSLVQSSLVYPAFDSRKLKHHILCVEDQHWLRLQLDAKGLVAFVADGSLLPRTSGADDRPMALEKNVVHFKVCTRCQQRE